MASKKRRNSRKRRKTILLIEIIVLILLALVLCVSIWVAKKFSLINHQELDSTKVVTSSQANMNTSTETQEPAVQDQVTSEPAVQETQQTADTGLTGVEMIALVGLDSRDDEDGKNSDVMMIACINHSEKTIKLVSVYRDTYLDIGNNQDGVEIFYKANAAYNFGGPEQFLTMLNLNLDLDIVEFVRTDFKALADTIDLLGGLDIEMTREEVGHLNNYNVETSQACGVEYVAVELPPEDEFDGAMTMSFHLNGSQAVSYARIRYTEGNDFRRAARQRVVLQKTMDAAKSAGIGAVNNILNAVLPQIVTNLDNSQIMSLIQPLLTYEIAGQTGFPFDHLEDDIDGCDCVIPVTLETNVIKLHEYLFPGTEYYPSETVQAYSNRIIMDSGYGVESIPTESESGEIPVWDPTAEAA